MEQASLPNPDNQQEVSQDLQSEGSTEERHNAEVRLPERQPEQLNKPGVIKPSNERTTRHWLGLTEWTFVTFFHLGVYTSLRRNQLGATKFDELHFDLMDVFLKIPDPPARFAEAFAREKMSWKAAHLAGMQLAGQFSANIDEYLALQLVQVTYETVDNSHLAIEETKRWLERSNLSDRKKTQDPKLLDMGPHHIHNTQKDSPNNSNASKSHENPTIVKVIPQNYMVAPFPELEEMIEMLLEECATASGPSPNSTSMTGKTVIIQQPDYHAMGNDVNPGFSGMPNHPRGLLVRDETRQDIPIDEVCFSDIRISHLKLDRHGNLQVHDKIGQIENWLPKETSEDWNAVNQRLNVYLFWLRDHFHKFAKDIMSRTIDVDTDSISESDMEDFVDAAVG